MNLTKYKSRFVFFTILFYFTASSLLKAEQFATCEVNFNGCFIGSRQICSMDVYPGESIVTKVSFKNYARYGYNGYGEFSYSGARSGSMRLYSGQSGELSRHGINKGIVKVGFNDQIPRLCDFLSSAKVYTDRANLKVFPPSIDSSTGDLYMPYGVTTSTPMNAGSNWVGLVLSAYGPSARTRVGEWGLGSCLGKGNCTDTIKIPFSQRPPIPRESNYLHLQVNDYGNERFAETTLSDNISGAYLDSFFLEQIPRIMENYSPTWWLAREFLNRWIDKSVKFKNPSITGIDWNLDTFSSMNTTWFLDPKNASDSRIRDKFNQLIDPNYFDIPATRNIVRQKVIEKFKNMPSTATYASLSARYGNGAGISIKDYHNQHITHIDAQGAGYSNLDAVTAAFGAFSFYLVPIGSASKKSTTYSIRITSVAVHVIDSFDFNGDQSLGCWRVPRTVKPSYSNDCITVTNSTFRWYRRMKVRGWDHNIFDSPYEVDLKAPLVYSVKR